MWKIIIISIVAIKEIVTAIREGKKESSKKSTKYLIVGLSILASVLLGIVAIDESVTKSRNDGISSRVGEFNGTNSRYTKTTYPLMTYFGTNEVGGFKENVSINGQDYLHCWIEDGRIMLDFDIKDSRGNVIASIKPEGWKIYSSQIDYNNDQNGFEVIRGDGKVIFQIELKGNVVVSNGVIYVNGSKSYLVGDNTGMRMIKIPENTEDIWLPSVLNLQPIFKYPREKHFGERN